MAEGVTKGIANRPRQQIKINSASRMLVISKTAPLAQLLVALIKDELAEWSPSNSKTAMPITITLTTMEAITSNINLTLIYSEQMLGSRLPLLPLSEAVFSHSSQLLLVVVLGNNK